MEGPQFDRLRFLERSLASSADGLMVVDAAGRLSFLNDAGRRIIGRAPAPDLAIDAQAEQYGLRYPDGRPIAPPETPVGRAVRGETINDFLTILRKPDGSDVWITINASPVRDDADRIVGAIGIYRDVSERVRAESEIKRLMAEAENRAAELDAIVENMAEGLIVINTSDDVVRINRAALRLIGVGSAADVPKYHAICEGLNVRSRDGSPLPIDERGQSRALRGEEFVEQETLINGIDGVERRLFSTASPVRDEAGNVVLAVAVYRDVTRDREIEAERERLLANERAAHDEAVRHAAQLRALLASLGEAVVVADASGRIVLRNDAARRISGRSDDHMQALMDARDVPMFDVDGAPIPVEKWPISRALRDERFTDEEIAIALPDGRRRRILVSGAGVREDGDGVVLGIVVFRDVTELRRLQESKDEIVALISHDLRNPLTVLTGHVDLLRARLLRRGLAAEAENAEKALRGARRLNSMIQDLVESARLESGQLELRARPTSLPELLADIAERVGTPEDRARVRVEVAGEVPPVAVDPERLERAVVNLITNALKYSPPDKSVIVRVVRDEGTATVTVADEGPGIPADELPRLFERFYRATAGRMAGGGLGLGLYITRLIVEAHGGRLWAKSEMGVGSTFGISLPIR